MTKSSKEVMQQALDALYEADILREDKQDVTARHKAIDNLRTAIAIDDLRTAIEQSTEPTLYQFQAEDGAWCSFMDERHYKNTVADGRWPIRALYEHPIIAQPIEQTCESNFAIHKLKIGSCYKWKTQPELLIYLGKHGLWHKFKKLSDFKNVECEVWSMDLRMLEETAQPVVNPNQS